MFGKTLFGVFAGLLVISVAVVNTSEYNTETVVTSMVFLLFLCIGSFYFAINMNPSEEKDVMHARRCLKVFKYSFLTALVLRLIAAVVMFLPATFSGSQRILNDMLLIIIALSFVMIAIASISILIFVVMHACFMFKNIKRQIAN